MDPGALLAGIRSRDPKFNKLRPSAALPPRALALALAESGATTELVLTGNHYSRTEFCELFEALSLSKHLRVLDLSCTGMDEDSLLDAIDLVRHSKTLYRVDLSFNDVSPEAAAMLGEALRDHVSLRTLILRDTDLRDDGVEAFLGNLTPDGCTLHKLVLAHNGITDQGSAAIAAFARKSTELASVVLNGNSVPRDVAASLVASCSRNVARLGYDPRSRPSTQVEQTPRRPTERQLPELGILTACDARGLLPNLYLLSAIEV